MKLHPLISIILGLIVTFFCYGSLGIILGINSPFFGLNYFAIAMISLFIGAFVCTFFAKEKKIKYGIYLMIIFVILGFLNHLHFNITHHITYLNYQFLVDIGAIVGYFFIAVIGGYIGIILSKTFKTKH
jgi:hypothetical protein